MKYKHIFFAISLFFLVPGIFSLFRFGLKPAIDFTGGSLLEIQIISEDELKLASDEVIESLSEIYEVGSIQSSGDNQYILRGKAIDNEKKNSALDKVQSIFESEVIEVRFETVGPTLGKELLFKTVSAIILVSVLITLYVWKQFSELKFGICAILAMFHDSLILLGSFSLLGHFFGIEVDVLFVTAILTTLSFSIHDTIVVFDRIRELSRKHSRQKFETIANIAVLETLSRSINNSVTIIVMLAALFLLGGESIRNFSLALLIGAVTGTYSSTFTAVPLLLKWDEIKGKRS